MCDNYPNNSSCPSGPTNPTIYVTSVSVYPKNITIGIDEWYYDAFALTLPDNATCSGVFWTSDNPAIASVNSASGLICGNSAGTTTIRAFSQDGSNVSDSCTVTVLDNVVESIVLNSTSLTLNLGQNYVLNATVYPQNAINNSLLWSSSNTNVATVDNNGSVYAKSAGTAIITVTTMDCSSVTARCVVTVDSTIAITDIKVEPKKLMMYIGQTATIDVTMSPSTATEDRTTIRSSNENVAIINTVTGINTAFSVEIKAFNVGTTTVTVTTQDGRLSDFCQIVVTNRYHYELIHSYGFTEEISELIMDLYDKVDNIYSSETNLERAWRCARLLSEFDYETDEWDDKWDVLAGSVVDNDNREDYFIHTLGYTQEQYTKMSIAISKQHDEADSNMLNDFSHMQYSLAARLAYTLDKISVLANIGVIIGTKNIKIYTNEEASYFGGWLGDAVLAVNNGTTAMGNADYMADLDAENIYQLLLQDPSSVKVISNYYSSLSSTNNRAHIFRNHISYEIVRTKVFYELIDAGLTRMRDNAQNDFEKLYYISLLTDEEYHWNILKNQYPDTYNFLKSLYDYRPNMGTY